MFSHALGLRYNVLSVRKLRYSVQACCSDQWCLGCRWKCPRRDQPVSSHLAHLGRLLNWKKIPLGITESMLPIVTPLLFRSDLVLISTATIRTTRAQSVKTICERYEGNNNGDEPPETGSGPDGTVSFFLRKISYVWECSDNWLS